MPLYRATVIVLRRRAFEETDKQLVLYSREHGKISAIAKGARRAQSRFVGATEPLVHCRMQLATGRNMDIVSEAVVKHPFLGLRETPSKIEAALYLAELTDALVDERQASQDLFDLLLSSLHLLESKECEELIVRRFELQALDLSGYTPEVHRCVICRALRPEDRPAAFSARLGGIVCSRCRSGQDGLQPGPAGALRAIEDLLTLAAHRIDSLQLSPSDTHALSRICREHIACHLERDLRAQIS